MDEQRNEIRFIISKKKKKELQIKAKQMDVPLSNYIKLKLFEEEKA